ncbi:hypothetical protein [Sphingomonas sp. CFBP 13720]|uniref:hypothetical protein n=1 Tax=Sphingomonas sp. CFBP 13720 TaxID=2775302 RepID=UPI00178113DE|nr:hypothetical protein [Sphingomonas sp. CFBP 13720]MBD8677916.1 hypothetical protein [Sphingomonas sp. CFBP 13720]
MLLRRLWWLVPIVALAAGWLWTDRKLADARLTIANERQAHIQNVADADRAKAAAEVRYASALADAADQYAARLTARDPIILKSTDTVTRYAQTDAGRARCRGADRVRAIDELDAELAEPPATASSGADTLSTDATTPPVRR